VKLHQRNRAHDQSGCVFADEIRGMARVFGRHMLASDNCRRAPCTCHVAQDTAGRRGLGPLWFGENTSGPEYGQKRRELWLRSSQKAGHWNICSI